MYDGGKTFTGVSDNATQQKNMTQVAVAQFEKLGFKVDMKYVVRDSMYTKFCQVPGNQPDVCPSVGWLKDFADRRRCSTPCSTARTSSQANSNFALLDDPDINKAMDKAEVVNDPAQRRKDWGEIDKMVTEVAAGIPWLWDKQPMLRSRTSTAWSTRPTPSGT